MALNIKAIVKYYELYEGDKVVIRGNFVATGSPEFGVVIDPAAYTTILGLQAGITDAIIEAAGNLDPPLTLTYNKILMPSLQLGVL